MLVAAPAFVLLGALAIHQLLSLYCKDLWEPEPPEAAEERGSAGGAPPSGKSKKAGSK